MRGGDKEEVEQHHDEDEDEDEAAAVPPPPNLFIAMATASTIIIPTAPPPVSMPLPIQACQVLRERTADLPEIRRTLLAGMDAGRVAHCIIKKEEGDRRLYALAIARRLRYCLGL